MLRCVNKKFHIVREGQTAGAIAAFYGVSAHLLARENGLKEEPYAGQILKIPAYKGNRYTVREGDTKALLCGSDEGYYAKNGTHAFYIGMEIIL